MGKFKLSALMLAMFATCNALAAAESDAPNTVKKPQLEEDLEVIEVRGFSRSLIQSLNQKRFTDTVSEQLSADDLGALPDVSMADALTRLPGISAVRTGGRVLCRHSLIRILGSQHAVADW